MIDLSRHAVGHRRGLLFLGLSAVMLLAGVGRCLAEDEAKPITLVIDYSDGVQKHFTQIAWREGFTVLDAMLAARQHPRGIRFEHEGRGATAFLAKIDDLKNEGRGRNWLYRVNGKRADRSFGVARLQPGDTVLWKFEESR